MYKYISFVSFLLLSNVKFNELRTRESVFYFVSPVSTTVATFPCCEKAMLFFYAGWQRQTSASILVLFLIFSVRFIARTLWNSPRALWEGTGTKRREERASVRERERVTERERKREKDGASIAMRHGRMHLAQTYQSLYRVLGKHCNLGLSMPWCLNYQWPTTHPFSSAKESPHQRQHDFKKV